MFSWVVFGWRPSRAASAEPTKKPLRCGTGGAKSCERSEPSRAEWRDDYDHDRKGEGGSEGAVAAEVHDGAGRECRRSGDVKRAGLATTVGMRSIRRLMVAVIDRTSDRRRIDKFTLTVRLIAPIWLLFFAGFVSFIHKLL